MQEAILAISTIRIQKEKKFNPLLITDHVQLMLPPSVKMEHIVLVDQEEEHAQGMEVLQDGYDRLLFCNGGSLLVIPSSFWLYSIL